LVPCFFHPAKKSIPERKRNRVSKSVMSPVRRGIRASDLRPLASAETLYRHFFVG
jgi:hypothetical protein